MDQVKALPFRESAKRYFGFEEAGTNLRTEILAGLTTFLTMAYIIFVNPAILGDAGMPKAAVFVATCLVAAIATLIMGLYANYPIACAPGMGLNAYFAYTVVKGMGFTWEAALGAVFISGCLFMIVTLLGVRGMIVNGIPRSIRAAITGGIGLFLAIISLKTAGVVVGNPATLVTLGDLSKPDVALAAIGFFAIVTLDVLRVRGAILIGIRLRPRSRRRCFTSTSTLPCPRAFSTSSWCSSSSNCSMPPAR